MKKEKLQNPKIIAAVAALGHTEFLCIVDCGMPIPKDVPLIDVSVTATIPSFLQVLEAVNSELVVESYIYAKEIDQDNPEVKERIVNLMKDKSVQVVPHNELKKLLSNAKCIIRTGETSPYANIILVGGVNF